MKKENNEPLCLSVSSNKEAVAFLGNMHIQPSTHGKLTLCMYIMYMYDMDSKPHTVIQ